MSVRIMSAVWGITLPDSEKLVLLALADCANDEGVCWPSMATLAAKCSKSDRTVQASIKRLVAAGHLTRVETPGKGCRYIVTPTTEAASPPKRLRPEAVAPPKRTTSTPEAASDKPSRTTTSPKASPSPRRRAAAPAAFVPPSDIPEAEWDAFEEMRRKLRKPLTNHARQLAIRDLRRLAEDGHPPGDVLNQSTLRCWQGLFPIKDDRNGQRPHHDRPSAWASRVGGAGFEPASLDD